MKILLVSPPFSRFFGLSQDYVPLSLLSVGSKMVEEGHTVFIKNLEVGEALHYEGYAGRAEHYNEYLSSVNDENHPIWQEFCKTLEEIKPDQIGINVLNVKYKSALKCIDIAKKYNIPVMVGGHHPITEPNSYPCGVEVFLGEYESRGGRVKNLDDTPFPNYDILLDKYSPNGYAHIMSSRGCPFNCKFCASKVMWERKVTYKSADRILQEMRYIENRFKSDYFTFWDEVFTVNKKRLYEFCSKYNLSAKWRCDTRADIITDEMAITMKEANCGQMSLGLESGDNEILKSVGKNETTDTFIRAAEILHKNNIQWKAYMIVGFPKDTEETIIKSLSFVKSLKPFRVTLSFFTPYKGTELFEESKRLGLINDKYDMSLFSHQSPYNHFCPNIPLDRYNVLKKQISQEIDDYNKEALGVWK